MQMLVMMVSVGVYWNWHLVSLRKLSRWHHVILILGSLSFYILWSSFFVQSLLSQDISFIVPVPK